jgi:hypothetical protein
MAQLDELYLIPKYISKLELFLAPTSTCVSTIFTTNPNDIKVHIEYYVPCDLSYARSSFPFTFVCYNEFFNAFCLGLQEAKYTYIMPKNILKKFFYTVDLKSQIALGKSSKIMILRSRKLGHCDGKCSKNYLPSTFLQHEFLNDVDWLQT